MAVTRAVEERDDLIGQKEEEEQLEEGGKENMGEETRPDSEREVGNGETRVTSRTARVLRVRVRALP